MNIYQGCDNCVHIGINENCLRYPPLKILDRGVHTQSNPQTATGNMTLWQEACGEYKPDFITINRRLDKYTKKIDDERRVLKREIKRLGGNPRKIKAI